MFEKLGKKKFAVPFVVPVLLIRLFALMFYPMANMELKHMPFAVVCLDEGADLPTGSVNAGQQMKDQAADAALEQMLAQAGGSQAAQAQAAGDVSAAQAAAAAQAGSGSEAAQQAQARQAQMQAIFAFGCQEIAFVCDLLLCMRLLRSYRIARPGEMRS